jgi:hypothetical protein
MLIPVQNYTTAYYIVLSSLIFLSVLHLFKDNLESYPSEIALFFFTLLSVVVILFIGLREPWGNWRFLGDTSAYTRTYHYIEAQGLDNVTKDFGFYLFMYLCSKLMNVQGFYILSAFLYVVPVAYTFRRHFSNYAFFAFLLYVSSMSFWAFGINGLRNGLAASFFIFSLNSLNRKWIMFLIIALSVSFHMSMLVPTIALITGFYVKNTKVLVFIWGIVALLMYFIGDQIELIISNLLNQLNFDDRSENIYSNDFNEIIQRRYRLDFVIYSAVPIFLGYWFIQKKEYINKFYTILLNTYIIANTIWLLMIYAAYTNRIAFLSWFLMPLVLIYPLLKEKLVQNQGQFIGLMILASLGFTLFLQFIL